MSLVAILPPSDLAHNTLVGLGDHAAMDAFGRLRTSNPHVIFDSTFRYDLTPFQFWNVTANGGTVAHDANLAMANISVAAQSSSSAFLQSKAYPRYIPGKSRLVFMTQVVGAAQSSVVKRAGTFDTDNGIYLEQNGTTDVAFVRRTKTSGSVVNNRVVQANWNLDQMDGHGPSGVALDLSKDSILVIDYQWLGMGRVRCGFDIGGTIVYVHEFLAANVLTVPYMQSGSLPVRWEVTNTAALAGSMYAGCSAVMSEGGEELESGYIFHHASGKITAANGTRTPIVCIRPAATLNSVTNRIQITVESVSCLDVSATPVLWELVYNPTITGGSWVAEDSSNSAVEYNITATSLTGGTDYGAAFNAGAKDTGIGTAIKADTRYPLVLDPNAANPIPLALVATGLGTTADVYGSITWREHR